jgi:hypothetical protein
MWIVFLSLLFAACAEYACKMSVLFFYQRIFLIDSTYRKISLTLMILSTAWFLAGPIATLSMCKPFGAFFHPGGPGECQDWGLMLLPMLIINTVIDLAILLLLIRTVLALQLPKKMKVAVAGIFALGGFVMITNVV